MTIADDQRADMHTDEASKSQFKARAVESTRLPGEFHKDPADRMIVALARRFNVELVTADDRIMSYKHVRTLW
ncbi:hypothetical protein [Alkalilimnicola sp. S0819]|uniref:hypothetical protein n=1 Tax=Alkalilimnicola sp. S0819 TaxID=2613922 RepID=UPI001D00B6D4|nr:hypothetical protein [Alkalilimnicola sp. S0819]